MQEAEKQPRPRGSGSIFTNHGSKIVWIKYYSHGISHRESSGSTDPKIAEALLRRRLGEIAAGVHVPPANVRVDDLIRDVITDYKRNGKKSLADVERRWQIHLKPWFGRWKASEVTTASVARYIDSREQSGAKYATINRELALLRYAFNLAHKARPPKVAVVPHIPQFRENNRRTGFLDTQQESRLMDECGRVGLWLRTAFEIGLSYGWRLSEIRNLQVKHVDLLQRTLSLDGAMTKNGQGRYVRLSDALCALLSQCVRGKRPNDYLLTREDGRRLKDFRKQWHATCCRAGLGRMGCPNCHNEDGTLIDVDTKKCCPNCGRKWKSYQLRYVGLLFHDLRRSMARNMRNEGISEEIIMEIGGWKTSAVFKRYSIVNANDTAEAVRRTEAARKRNMELFAAQQATGAFGQDSGKVSPKLHQMCDKSGNSESAEFSATPLPN